jgi:hypothetical protein
LYRFKQRLIAENYPEVKSFLTEIVKKTYDSSLKADDMCFIYSNFEEGEVSVLFSSKTLIQNIIKQQEFQPSFIHLDSTYKLIDLGLPLVVLSTEDINHQYRPVAFFISWAESTAQVTLMLTKLKEFLSEKFDFDFQPKFVLTDNSDALIAGCKKAFTHDYIHLACHFHIGKNVKEKSQAKGSEGKEKRVVLWDQNPQKFSYFGIFQRSMENNKTILERFRRHPRLYYHF